MMFRSYYILWNLFVFDLIQFYKTHTTRLAEYQYSLLPTTENKL